MALTPHAVETHSLSFRNIVSLTIFSPFMSLISGYQTLNSSIIFIYLLSPIFILEFSLTGLVKGLVFAKVCIFFY